MTIKYYCDVCKNINFKENTRTIVIHRRQRNVYIQRPVLNPNKLKNTTKLVCLNCLKKIFDYAEIKEKKR